MLESWYNRPSCLPVRREMFCIYAVSKQTFPLQKKGPTQNSQISNRVMLNALATEVITRFWVLFTQTILPSVSLQYIEPPTFGNLHAEHFSRGKYSTTTSILPEIQELFALPKRLLLDIKLWIGVTFILGIMFLKIEFSSTRLLIIDITHFSFQ